MMKTTVEKIIEEIDNSTMLGAAWDCLSDAAKERFKKKLQSIIDDMINLQSGITLNK